MTSHHWRVHAHYSPQHVERRTYVSSLWLSHTPHRSRTGTTGWDAWRMLWCVRERSRPSSPSQLWIARSLSSYDVIIYLFCTELLLYSKDVTFISVPWVIICVRLGPSTPGDYVRARVLVPPKTRVWHTHMFCWIKILVLFPLKFFSFRCCLLPFPLMILWRTIMFLYGDLVWGLIGGELHLSDHCGHPVVAVFGRDLRWTQFELILENLIKTLAKTGFLICALSFELLGLVLHVSSIFPAQSFYDVWSKSSYFLVCSIVGPSAALPWPGIVGQTCGIAVPLFFELDSNFW
jgi:hypothetical protein